MAENDYEKILKEALNNKSLPFEVTSWIEEQFPQLAESEDKRIKKALMQNLKERFGTKGNMGEGLDMPDVLAWLEKQGDKVSAIEGFETEFERQVSHLIASAINREYEYNEGYVKWTANALLNFAKHELEKQGEKKSTNIIPKFKIGDIIRHKGQGCTCKITAIDTATAEYGVSECNGIHLPFDFQDAWELVEQEPTKWSEEDERILYNIIQDYEDKANGEKNEVVKAYINKVISWLKSLKDRFTWKPSEEQIKAVRLARSFVTDDFDENPTLSDVLVELEKQLKKLREEFTFC